MKTDLLLVPFGVSFSNLLDAAKAAEVSGFDGVWLWDHLSGAVHGETHVLECWTSLTTLAALVPRIMVGPLVLNVANRHPGVLAVMASTLQQSSGGRLLLGLGAGGGNDTPYAREQNMIGRTVGTDAQRRSEVTETIEQIKGLWNNEMPGYLVPHPAPPIIVGGFGPKMARLAGRHGDGFNTPATHSDLEGLLRICRSEHQPRATGREFIFTVFAGLSKQWLSADGSGRRRLEQLGWTASSCCLIHPLTPGRLTRRAHCSEAKGPPQD